LQSNSHKRYILFVLNDNIADGKDVSWIWDIDFEQVLNSLAGITVAGTRARDLALRLKYAGLPSAQLVLVPAAPLRAERRENRAQPSARRRQRAGTREIAAESLDLPEVPVVAEKSYGIAQALDRALAQTPEGETLFIVPTYTGLLEIHRELERRGLTPHYWEETGP
jgi:hypothetical protein